MVHAAKGPLFDGKQCAVRRVHMEASHVDSQRQAETAHILDAGLWGSESHGDAKHVFLALRVEPTRFTASRFANRQVGAPVLVGVADEETATFTGAVAVSGALNADLLVLANGSAGDTLAVIIGLASGTFEGLGAPSRGG